MLSQEKALRKRLEDLERELIEIGGNGGNQDGGDGKPSDSDPVVKDMVTRRRQIVFALDTLRRRIEAVEDGERDIKETDATCVRMGSVVRISLNGKERELRIVESRFVNPGLGFISRESPLGNILFGVTVGDRRTYAVRGRKFEITILSVEQP